MELFTETDRTYKTRANAVRVIDGIKAEIAEALATTDKENHSMTFSWIIGTNEEGRFFPVITNIGSSMTSFYFINKGCCFIG